MMRARAKLDSYALLAEALGECGDFDWTLTIIGDGPERARVEELFAAFAGKVRFTGELERGAVIAELCGADAMVWPGFNEAYGLVYLEAQAAGVPVVALDRPAHHDVIVPGRTGLLAGSGAEEFAAAIRSVATDADLRRRLGQAGRAFVHAERTLGDAARRFEAGLCACARGQGRRARGADFPRARAALDSIAEGGKSVPVWLRDDDAAAPTHQLDRLIETLCGRGLAVNLAVIARYATPALAERLRGEDGASVSVHGSAHTNHSGAGEKSSEYGPSRGREDVLRELAQARARIRDLFGGKALAVFVPPWNRMEPAHHAALAQTGFAAISTFGPKGETAGAGLAALPTHVDIMDWRNRCGLDAAAVDEALAGSLAHWMQAGGRAPIGLLTHHLVHDEAAWTCLEGLAQLLGGHAGARWIGLDQAVGVAQ